MVVRCSGNSSQLYCPINGGCRFLAPEPVQYIVELLKYPAPALAARLTQLRSAFFTDQLLTAIPYSYRTPKTVNFREQRPAASVSLQNVNITCKSLVVHDMPAGLPVPILPDDQQVQALSDLDLVDAIRCACPAVLQLCAVTPTQCTGSRLGNHATERLHNVIWALCSNEHGSNALE